MVTVASNGGRVAGSAPSRACRAIDPGYVSDGDTFTLLETSADGAWLKIDFGSDGGWIYRQPWPRSIRRHRPYSFDAEAQRGRDLRGERRGDFHPLTGLS